MSFSGKRSLHVPGVTHGPTPIPMGARVGNLICSSAISGKDPASDSLPAEGVDQVRFAFANMETLLRNGGATVADLVKVTVFLKDNGLRDAVNDEWLRLFPDPDDRPARHIVPTDLQRGQLIQLEVMAVVQEG